jgi:colanic acid biosynthesis glycosyl transferase WcaI
MHVCFFNRSYWPDFGATGQLLTELAEDLVAHHECEVTVVAGYPLKYPASLPSRDVRNGVRILRASGTTFDPKRFVLRAANYVTYFISACIAALRIPRPDVVVAMTDPPIIGLAALLAAHRGAARFVFLCQDIFPEVATLVEDFRNERVDGALDRIGRFLVQHADATIALGETMKRRLVDGKGGDPSKIVVIHNWADCTALAPGPKDNPFARAYGLSDRFVVMHAGNLGLAQNLEVALDAADRLHTCNDVRFVMIGDGSRRQTLEERARARGLDNVMFLPYQAREAMAGFYASADVFLISLKPGLAGYIVPSKLYGILAAGRPYVAAVEDLCEVAAITREHACGFVVPPGDGDALASRLFELYQDRQLASVMGGRARRAGLTFDRKRQIAAHASLLHRVARTGSNNYAGAGLEPRTGRSEDLPLQP